MATNLTQRPQLSLSERDRRWGMIRDAMRRRDLACLIIWGDSGKWDSKMANVRYVTQIGGNGEEAVCIFPIEEDPTVITWTHLHNFEWMGAQSWVSDIRGRELRSWSGSIAKRIKELKVDGEKIGMVGLGGTTEAGGAMPWSAYDQLKRDLPRGRFENATAIIEEPQLVKSPEEVTFIEKATAMGDLGAKAMYACARPGADERDVVAEAIHAMIKEGSDIPIMFLFNSGSPPQAQRSSRLMYTRARILESGDLISTEYSPRYGGYFSHLQRPCFVGEPRKEYRRMFEVALNSYRAGLKMLRAGLKLGELCRVMGEPIKKAGLHLCGPLFHGIGLQWMPPYGNPVEAMGQMPVMEKSLQDRELKAGMVLGFEVGPQTEGGEISFTIGNPILVTETGMKDLSRFEVAFVTT